MAFEWGCIMGNFLEKIESVRDAFKAGLYEPALALALTLPDICAKIEHQSMSSARGYIEWCDAHIFTSQSTPAEKLRKIIPTTVTFSFTVNPLVRVIRKPLPFIG